MSEAGRFKWLVRKMGLELRRANEWTVSEYRVRGFLERRGIATVLDVGANDGGYASALFRAGWAGGIVSYEPLPDAWERLQQAASGNPRWAVAPRIALSDRAGEATFFEAGNSCSSSLLPMTDTHVAAAPESATMREITVPTARLDDVIGEAGQTPYFLKLDVQGGELLVLEGARESLASTIVGIQTEVSLQTLYHGQPQADEVHRFLSDCGFELWDFISGFRDPSSMRLLQYDAVYFRA